MIRRSFLGVRTLLCNLFYLHGLKINALHQIEYQEKLKLRSINIGAGCDILFLRAYLP
jgi:hypothetical protein